MSDLPIFGRGEERMGLDALPRFPGWFPAYYDENFPVSLSLSFIFLEWSV
jgi:hypothetical protein